MAENSSRERDLVLAPNEYAFISDQTKGHITVYVGPCKTSLANTDQPVVFNDKSKRFESCHLEKAISPFAIAPEGWYIVMKNPGHENLHPKTATSSNLPELLIGKKINIPGPISFALWPGQMVRTILGHHLRLNQYLLVRVYDEIAAKENWKTAVIKPQTGQAAEHDSGAISSDPSHGEVDLTMGKQLIIKGTDVSFYIPPTGIEVVREGPNNYVRSAVTLERLEYCILRDEDGNKRFIRGPAVVFPQPSETFIERNGSRKFKAIELNEISGLYIKVIAPYKEGDVEYKGGEEIFITGKDQMIYFPRPEHAIIKYTDQEIHFAVAIPAGEGRYVLDRLAGKISLIRGPRMYLADPRKEVIVQRVLDPRVVELWFPGNTEAMEYNRRLKTLVQEEADQYLAKPQAAQALEVRLQSSYILEDPAVQQVDEKYAGDDFTRGTQFTPPRTITLDTKYEGAVSIDVWTGYAVLVVSKTGERKVIVGPQTYLLSYDESLEGIELSTGTPKSDDRLIKTVYMRTLHNKVSDIVEVESKDLCRVKIRLSYRVNFEGEPEKWFDVENYVKFLTDHMRSILRNAMKQTGIEKLYADSINIVRETILGIPGEDGHRPGRLFLENGMRIYDVEVLDAQIGDQSIEKLLVEAQHEVVVQTLQMNSERRRLQMTEEMEGIKQKMAAIQAETKEKVESVKQLVAQFEATTKQKGLELQTVEVNKQLELNLAQVAAEGKAQKLALDAKLAEQEALGKISASELERRKEEFDLNLGVAQRQLQQRIEEVKAEVEGVVSKAQAISPDLIAALQAFGDRALAEKMAEAMAPLAILGGKSISDVFAQLVKDTPVENLLKKKLPPTK